VLVDHLCLHREVVAVDARLAAVVLLCLLREVEDLPLVAVRPCLRREAEEVRLVVVRPCLHREAVVEDARLAAVVLLCLLRGVEVLQLVAVRPCLHREAGEVRLVGEARPCLHLVVEVHLVEVRQRGPARPS
jgi:hypothetical protein